MVWTYAIYAFIIIFSLTAILSLLNIKSKVEVGKPIESYLLAQGELGKTSIVNLLLSSSFGINALFYAVWLGYTVGFWALIIQFAWGLSFYLLSKHSRKIREHNSLHELLGTTFNKTTRIVAGCCSLAGITIMLGWEVGVGTSALNSLLNIKNEFTGNQTDSKSLWLTIAIISGCLFYTVLGGLRGNAKADKLLNLIKIATIGLLTLFISIQFFKNHPASLIGSSYFPPLSVMVKNLGWWGLATNIAFNVAWQFVDNSSWQSIIAGKKSSESETISTLKASGVFTFLIPGALGAILGISLVGIAGVTPDNIFFVAVNTFRDFLPEYGNVIIFLAFITIFACVMSLIDGLFLASTYALIIDILHPTKNITELDKDEIKANKLLMLTKIVLIILALISTLGVRFVLKESGLNLFDFVYIVIISQLALGGLVLTSLFSRKKTKFPAWGVILIALITGFGSIILGSKLDSRFLIDGAGIFTLSISLIAAFITTKRA